MNSNILNKLDNPVWNALSETHNPFSISFEGIKFYKPEYCPFGGMEGENDYSEQISNYSNHIDSFFIVGKKPVLPDHLKFQNELVCLQMIIEKRISVEFKDEISTILEENYGELYRLVNLVQPGYFREKTPQMGNYFGIYKNGKLVATTGERMKTYDLTEVSAVVTHPDYLGKGYAKQLIGKTVNDIFDQNRIPFLHVAESNFRAIQLYYQLGFSVRRKISFWNIKKINN